MGQNETTVSFEESLRSIGVVSERDLICSPVTFILERTGVDQETLLEARKAVLKKLCSVPKRGDLLYKKMLRDTLVFSTGCKAVDDLLDGGLFTGEITELTGPPASGKTQLCFSTCLAAAVTMGASVLYVDTLGSFSPSRLAEIFWKNPLLAHRGTDLDSVLARIQCAKVHDIFQLLETLEGLIKGLADEGSKARATRLVVIDSVASVVSPILAGGGLFLGHSLMTSLARMLKTLAAEHDVAVLLTNYVVSTGRLTPGESKPALGTSWTYTSNIQLFLSIKSNDPSLTKRQIECRKTSRKCGNVASFSITSEGLI